MTGKVYLSRKSLNGLRVSEALGDRHSSLLLADRTEDYLEAHHSVGHHHELPAIACGNSGEPDLRSLRRGGRRVHLVFRAPHQPVFSVRRFLQTLLGSGPGMASRARRSGTRTARDVTHVWPYLAVGVLTSGSTLAGVFLTQHGDSSVGSTTPRFANSTTNTTTASASTVRAC